MTDSEDINHGDFKVITCSAEVECSADKTWSVVGSYADAGRFLNVPSKLVAGDGNLGSVRLIGDAVLEVMVGSSRHSYAYAQIRGPMAQFAYHGCLSVEEIGSERSKLLYTLVYEQTDMDGERRTSEAARISARFGGAAAEMKRQAEARG